MLGFNLKYFGVFFKTSVSNWNCATSCSHTWRTVLVHQLRRILVTRLLQLQFHRLNNIRPKRMRKDNIKMNLLELGEARSGLHPGRRAFVQGCTVPSIRRCVLFSVTTHTHKQIYTYISCPTPHFPKLWSAPWYKWSTEQQELHATIMKLIIIHKYLPRYSWNKLRLYKIFVFIFSICLSTWSYCPPARPSEMFSVRVESRNHCLSYSVPKQARTPTNIAFPLVSSTYWIIINETDVRLLPTKVTSTITVRSHKHS